ncbi:transglycosylase SLT domain-containing protein [Candidatus Woesearchaeota archaeon]|nr:transglycosylase SLT domain-containing protein [Candidatus Woesearchaeota archaeon]
MGLETGISVMKNHRSKRKATIEQYLDPSFAGTRSKTGTQSAALQWLRTAAQIGPIAAIAALAYTLNSSATLENFRYYKEQTSKEQTIAAFARDQTSTQQPRTQPTASPPSLPLNASLSDIAKTDKRSPEGKFLRAYRWNDTFTAAEKKYGIEAGILAGLAMRESYGNPLELNSGSDGGAGLFQFQPGTARQYGLHISGQSAATGRDRHNGRRLCKLIETYHRTYDALARTDERFHIVRSTYAAAHYLHDLKTKHGTWDNALSAYNRGTPSKNPLLTEHVTAVRTYQRYYLQHLSQLKNQPAKP